MWSTPSLPSLPGPLWTRVVAPDRGLSMGQIEFHCGFESLLFLHLNCIYAKLHTYAKLNYLKLFTFNSVYCPGYDIKLSDGEVPVMLEPWGMWSTPSLPSLPGALWTGVVAPDKGPIYASNRTKLRTNAKLNCLK